MKTPIERNTEQKLVHFEIKFCCVLTPGFKAEEVVAENREKSRFQ